MACLNITTGLFINSPPTNWRASGTDTAGGATVTASAAGVSVVKGAASQFFGAPGGGAVRFFTFGTPKNYILILTISDTSPGFPATRSVTHVNTSSPTLETTNLAFISATSTIDLPGVQFSQGNGSVFALLLPSSGGFSAALFRSDTGAAFSGGGTGVFMPAMQVLGNATATQLQILEGSVPRAAVLRPEGSCDVTPDPLNFPDAVLGAFDASLATPQRMATIRNNGTDCLTISAIGNVAPYSVVSTTPALPVTLDPGQTMTAMIRFAPAAPSPSSINVDLPITRAPAIGDAVIHCRGRARAATTAIGFATSIAFGRVPVSTTATRPLTISATGEAALTITIPASTGGDFSWPALNATVNPGGTPATLTVTFRPMSEGLQNAMLPFTSNAPTSPHGVNLAGTGCVARARIDAPPSGGAISLGNVQHGFRTAHIVRVRNIGSGTLNFRATASGSALFGVQTAGGSVTSPVSTLDLSVPPMAAAVCGAGATGNGEIVFAVTFYANDVPGVVTGQLTIDNHNDTTSGVPAAFTYTLTATIIDVVNADSVLVIDRSGSMIQASGERRKIDVAVDAGHLFVQLGRPDSGDRIGLAKFNDVPQVYRSIADLTAASQPAIGAAINLTELNPDGNTTVAGGVLVAVKDLTDHPRPTPPPSLNRAVIVLTDAIDNTPYTNPADGVTYSLLGGPVSVPGSGPFSMPATVMTTALPIIPGIKVYGVGIGDSIDAARLGQLAQATGGSYLAVRTFTGADYFKLEKHFTQIYMDTVDLATIVDPTYDIDPGQTHRHEFDVLAGDVNCMVVIYDRDGIRLPFHLETPAGEIVELTTIPAGFQLRPGITNTARFLEVRFPEGEPERYAGRWTAIVRHDGRACSLGNRPQAVAIGTDAGRFGFGFQPAECTDYRKPITYGIAIGVGSNFRMQAFVDPAIVPIGQPIRLNAMLSEFGLPVLGSAVNVTVVAPSGAATTLVLRDDGAHQDGDADDGDYGGLFTQTYESGNYEITFRATASSRDGEPVTREAVRSKFVEGTTPLVTTGTADPKSDCCKWQSIGIWIAVFLLILIVLLLWLH